MRKHLLLTALLMAGATVVGTEYVSASPSPQQQSQATGTVRGTVLDENGDPIVGASVVLKNSNQGVVTDADGHFTLRAKPGAPITISYIGYASADVNATPGITVTLKPSENVLNEVVVTALGIKKDKKSLGYAIDDVKSDELMLNKSTNAINSLSGKIAGVNVTTGSGAAGAGSQIILRGSTSLERDNQPLFVVDGVIYDNSTSVGGNSGYEGLTASNSTSSNRVMDLNPEDIENISVLKGPAASALYGSRAAQGVILITTKKGGEGSVEINLNANYTNSWATNLPETQKTYKRGYYTSDVNGNAVLFDANTLSSWGEKYGAGESAYDNIDDFFQNGGIWDTNLSVSGGNKNGNYYLSGSYYDQDGIVPTTGYTKTTFRFNGEQKYKIFTFGANAAYSQARTNKTLTSGGLYNSSGTGSMYALYNFPASEDMSHYLNEDGTKYRMFANYQNLEDDRENPYWLLENYSLKDNTERFTGSFNVKADITPWWWISYRMGIDSYTTETNNVINAGAAVTPKYQDGFISRNQMRYHYLSTNLMTNFSKQFGDFDFNLLLGTATDNIKTNNLYHYGWKFEVPGFASLNNILDTNKFMKTSDSKRHLVGVFGEFRVDWRNTVFLTVTGRNDWSSTLPVENRSYFYPSVSGSVIFTQFLQDKGLMNNDILSFGKIRASWARVGNDASPYVTNTYLNSVATMLGGLTGYGTEWYRGNTALKPETTESTEIGLELRFLKNRLKLDYAFYTNNTYNQIIQPRGAQSTGFIFCSQNAGDVYNKGMELTIGGTPVQTKDWEWETSLNVYGNRGTVKNLPDGTDILYVTDVQFGNAQAASFNNGVFLGISGYEWARDDQGRVILNEYGMPDYEKEGNANKKVCVGNREPKFQGGWNNTLRYKDFTFNMLWEFRVGGDVCNATEYTMTNSGISKFSENRESLTLSGVDKTTGEPVTYNFTADGTYNLNGATVSGKELIRNYYQSYYYIETANYIQKVNTLRLRAISLSYNLPKSLLAKTKAIKRASVTATANNLLLITNYRGGDPDVCAAGGGVSGSSSYGFDYFCVPNTTSFTFGVNLTF
jgi:TonB-linked SusC/RagA family outer membrane protein